MRGFRGLQGFDTSAKALVGAYKFQSPSGVLGVCRNDNDDDNEDTDDGGFSPLAGF